jgi:molybdopterin converting factor small subunit
MKVSVLFFGATADAVGEREIEFECGPDTNASSALASIVEKYPSLSAHKLLFAVNQEYVSTDQPIRDGDELAVFTAVSGG